MSEEPSATKQHSRLGMLDVLRFGAAVAVVVYHFTYNRAEDPGLFSVLAPVSDCFGTTSGSKRTNVAGD